MKKIDGAVGGRLGFLLVALAQAMVWACDFALVNQLERSAAAGLGLFVSSCGFTVAAVGGVAIFKGSWWWRGPLLFVILSWVGLKVGSSSTSCSSTAEVCVPLRT